MGWEINATPRPGKTRYPLYRRLGGPQDGSGRVRKITPPTGFDPRTVQLVASRYTDWAIPAHMKVRVKLILCQSWRCVWEWRFSSIVTSETYGGQWPGWSLDSFRTDTDCPEPTEFVAGGGPRHVETFQGIGKFLTLLVNQSMTLRSTHRVLIPLSTELPHFLCMIFFNSALKPPVDQSRLIIEFYRPHTTTHTVGRTTLDEWSARRREISTWQHNTHNRQTSMPRGGIRTRNLRRRAAADLRLRSSGHRDQLLHDIGVYKLLKSYINPLRTRRICVIQGYS